MLCRSGANIVAWGRTRIPPSSEIWSLFANIVFLIYGWTSIAFFWRLPSWLYILNAREIAVVAGYILTSNLIESLIVLTMFLLVCIVLPPRCLRNDLLVRGSVVMNLLTFWVAVLNLDSLLGLPTRSDMVSIACYFVLTTGLALLVAERVSMIHHFVSELSNRLIVFLYLWLPLSVVGIMIAILSFVL